LKNDRNRFKKDDNRFSANGRGYNSTKQRLPLNQANLDGSNEPSLTHITPKLAKISSIVHPFKKELPFKNDHSF